MLPNIERLNGDDIYIEKEENTTVHKEYFVTFSQHEDSPEDPTNPCANYPTEDYSSYAECDDDFVRRSLPPGLKPFWAVDDLSEASSSFTMSCDTWNSTPYGNTVLRYPQASVDVL